MYRTFLPVVINLGGVGAGEVCEVRFGLPPREPAPAVLSEDKIYREKSNERVVFEL